MKWKWLLRIDWMAILILLLMTYLPVGYLLDMSEPLGTMEWIFIGTLGIYAILGTATILMVLVDSFE